MIWLALLAPSLAGAEAPPRADPARSASCVGCHADQVAPLSRSRHGLAAGPGLWGQLPEGGPHVGAGLACLLCHAPAPDEQPWKTLATWASDGGTDVASAAITAGAAAVNPEFDPHAQSLGVSCTACHVEQGRIVGARVGPQAPHPVEPSARLGSPLLCARCHQFGPDAAVNGKPLENTYAEWQASPFGRAGATCQSCHVPAGRHLFQGVHTPSLVAASVEVTWTTSGAGTGALQLANTAVGHDFPSYTTPRVVLSVQAEDARGKPVGAPAEETLGRVVRFQQGRWLESSDTRVAPGMTHSLHYALTNLRGAARLHATVRVEPDAAYVPIYAALLGGKALSPSQRSLIEQALARARGSSFVIFDERRLLNAP